ncbi:MAG: DUF4377 domain-containing protein [Chloroflexi bacterium]|nr:DUF4377 domain-containing protein [Chloroflexota bacterium]
MPPKHWLGLVLTGLLLAACGPGNSQETYVVAAHKQECQGEALQLCWLITQPDGDEAVELLYDRIDGFDYQWGYTYVIRVEEAGVANPSADGSSVERQLIEVVEQSPVPAGTRFQMDLTGGQGYVVEVEENVFEVWDEVRFTCGPDINCDTVRRGLFEELRFTVEFEFSEDPDRPLTLVGWRPLTN